MSIIINDEKLKLLKREAYLQHKYFTTANMVLRNKYYFLLENVRRQLSHLPDMMIKGVA